MLIGLVWACSTANIFSLNLKEEAISYSLRRASLMESLLDVDYYARRLQKFMA